ncbi:MAG: PD-(D/E)XK motif protein [Clostridia bacterium]|nr:PD-(D/E)XK motif protein [Clostridia bacterium]
MDTLQIYNKLNEMGNTTNVKLYRCFGIGEYYYGVDYEKHIVFLTKSQNFQCATIQQTKQLIFIKNMLCTVETEEGIDINRFDIITCLATTAEHKMTFVELTNLFISQKESNITDYFICIKELFENKQTISTNEFQGIYAELFFIHYMKGIGVDICNLWQSIDRMKFDFSINDTKKVEVKSSIGESRIHKFRHEQLVTDIYDVWIVSMLLRKDDSGLSLYDLVHIVKDECRQNLQVLTHLENLLLNCASDDLKNIKYNESYTRKNMAFFKAIDVPRFKSNQPQGVSNTNYDSDLNNIRSREIEELKAWLIEN